MPLLESSFPDYVYREYPRFIATGPKDGNGHPVGVVVNNAHEEAELLAQQDDGAVDGGDDAERQALLDECAKRGIKVHPRTGIEKLKAALA